MIYFTVFQSLIIFKVIYPTLPLAYVTGLKNLQFQLVLWAIS